MPMKKLLLVLLLSFTAFRVCAAQKDSLLIMFWNVENFFDFKDDGTGPSDAEFSATGTRHWSKKRFYSKCGMIAKTLLFCADAEGTPPDVVGLAEVENAFVLKQLIYSTPLRKFGYSFVHFDSPDKRGIDCAALYRKNRLRKISAKACHITDSDGKVMQTRDILSVRFADATGEEICVLVNHHPSKLGSDSEERRQKAMQRMTEAADSIDAIGCHRIISIGDFNDEIPEFGCTRKLAPASGMKGGGTIKFNGKWEKIDGCTLTRGIRVSEKILDYPFLSTKDSGGSGLKPLRTYNGPRYLGGVSDHYPVLFVVRR